MHHGCAGFHHPLPSAGEVRLPAVQIHPDPMTDSIPKNLPDRKRRHHTVWRYYLTAWAQGGVVACLRGARTFTAGTTAIGVRTDFYALKELTPLEEEFVRRIGLGDDPVARPLNEGWLSMFLGPFRLRRMFEGGGMDRAAADKAIEILVSNVEEELHSLIEGRSIEHLNALRAGDLTFLVHDDDARGAFLHYLFVQYLRTPKFQATIMEAVRDAPGIRGDHIWPVLRHLYATTMALGLARKWADVRVSLLRTPPGIEFVTSDQPVINLFAVGTARFEEVTQLAFFYPIGPERALLIEDSPDPRFESPDLTPDEVAQVNRDMIAMLHEQAFATTEARLSELVP